MKQKIYNSTNRHYPVNYLKNTADESQMECTPSTTKSSFTDTFLINSGNAFTKAASLSLASKAVLRKHLSGCWQFLSRTSQIVLLTTLKWFMPFIVKANSIHNRLAAHINMVLDTFFNFVDSFILMDKAWLQPEPIANSGNERRDHNSGRKILNSLKKQIVPSFNKVADYQRIPENINEIVALYLKPAKAVAIKILPKIKLPLKTNNPNGGLPRPAVFYPVIEFVSHILTKCIKQMFLLKPKHLNPGLTYCDKPAF